MAMEAGMGVNEEIVQIEPLDQLPEAVVEEAHVVAFSEHPGDLPGLEAGGDEMDAPTHHRNLALAHIVGCLLDTALAPEVVVEGLVHPLRVQAEEDVDAGRLDVGINDTHPLALLGDDGGQVGGDVGFTCATTEGVDRDDFRHATAPFA
jgi:hypothetical protein